MKKTKNRFFLIAVIILSAVLIACLTCMAALAAPSKAMAETSSAPRAVSADVTLKDEADFTIEDTAAIASASGDADYGNSGGSYSKVLRGISEAGLSKISGATNVAIEIPSGVTVIEARSFKGASGGSAPQNKIVSVKIPSSVKIIGAEAFCYCNKLAEVNFDEGSQLEHIKGYATTYNYGVLQSRTTLYGAFYDCTSLTEITLPDNALNKVGEATFRGCTALATITLPFVGGVKTSVNATTGSATDLLGYMFSTSNESYSGGTRIPQYIYSNDTASGSRDYRCIPTSLKKVVITGGTDKNLQVQQGAFSGCTMLETVILPESIDTIHAGTFYGCTNLKRVGVGAADAAGEPSADEANFKIPSTVTSICKEAFRNCSNVTFTKLEIPDNTATIGANAFYECTSLQTVTGMKGVTTLNDGVFINCTKLSDISIKNAVNLEGVGANIFYNCTGLQSIDLPQNTTFTQISQGMFYNCDNLLSITIPSQVTKIGVSAFENCDYLGDVKLPSSLTEIGEKAFYYVGNNNSASAFKVDEIPAGVTQIGANAFAYTKISQITFNNSSTLQTLGASAFSECDSLTEITFPASLKTIGDSVMNNCNNLRSVTFLGNELGAISTSAFNYCQNLETINIPSSVTEIKNSAFYRCYKLKNVDLSICSGLQKIGSSAFRECRSVDFTSVSLPSSITSIGSEAFYGCTYLESVNIAGNGTGFTRIESNTFYGCNALRSFNIPTTVTYIGDNAFYNCGLLEELNIKNCSSLTTIGTSAFYGCRTISSLEIPASVETFQKGVNATSPASIFNGCTGLTSLIFNCDFTSDIGASMFSGCTRLADLQFKGQFTPAKINSEAFYKTGITHFTVPASVITISSRAFAESNIETFEFAPDSALEQFENNSTYGQHGVFYNCKQLLSIEIPATVTNMGNSTFNGCEKLAQVTFKGALIDKFGDYTFNNCPKLESLAIPSSVTTIGKNVFSNDVLLTLAENMGYYLPAGLTSIGESSFSGCTSLESINIPLGITALSNSLFDNCSSLKYIDFEDGCAISSIGSSTFRGCTVLQYSVKKGEEGVGATFAIPFSSAATIGEYAFQNCQTITSFILPESITDLKRSVFNGCTSLSSMSYGREEIVEGEFNFPSTLTTFGQYAFQNTAVVTLNLPENLGAPGDYMFQNSSKLVTVNLNAALTVIPQYSFQNCPLLSEVVIPDGAQLRSIQGHAFANCPQITQFEFDKLVVDKAVGDYAFFHCGFTDLDLSNLNDIGGGAFGFNNIARLTLPFIGKNSSTVTGTGSVLGHIFGGTLSVDGGDSWSNCYRVQQNYIYSGTSVTWTYFYIPNTLSTLTLVGANNAKIPHGAFQACHSLAEIILPDGLQTIGDYSFDGLSALKDLVIPDSVTLFEADGSGTTRPSHALLNTALTSIKLPFIKISNSNRIDLAAIFGQDKPEGGLSAYTSLTKIEFTQMEILGEYAVRNGARVTELILPGTITTIQPGALGGCTSLESLTLPFLGLNAETSNDATLASIFGGSVPSGLVSVTVLGGEIGVRAFAETNVEEVTLPENLSSIGHHAFYNSKIRQITIPSRVAVIPASAFEGCSDLASVTFIDRTVEIGERAFYNCASLSDITLSTSIDKIGAYAFYNCSSIEQLNFPANLNEIGAYAFYGCRSLDEIDIKNVTTLGAHAFENCKEMQSVVLSHELSAIPDYAFAGDSGITQITVNGVESPNVTVRIPDGVTKIGEHAFDGCSGFESIYLSNDLETIGRYAFALNSSLRVLYIPAGVQQLSAYCFQDCTNLAFVYLPEKALIASNSFANLPSSALLIAGSKAVYDAILEDNYLAAYAQQLTYLIPINYYSIKGSGEPVLMPDIAEGRLYKHTFDFVSSPDGSWAKDESVTDVNKPVSDIYATTVWRRTTDKNGAKVTTQSVNDLLSQNTTKIDLYAYVYDPADVVLEARQNLVYGDEDLPVLDTGAQGVKPETIINYLNSYILTDEFDGKLLNGNIYRVVKWEYTAADGSETAFRYLGYAGEYVATVNLVSSLGVWNEIYAKTVSFTIARRQIDVNIEWAATRQEVGDDGVAEGANYQLLEDYNGEINSAVVNGKNIMVRGNGKYITVGLYPYVMDEVAKLPDGSTIYSVEAGGRPNEPTQIGEGNHTTIFTLRLRNKINYAFYFGGGVTREELQSNYLLVADIKENDSVVTLTKTWYIYGGGDGGSSGGGGGTFTPPNTTPLVTADGSDIWEMSSGWTYGVYFDPDTLRPRPGYANAETIKLELTTRKVSSTVTEAEMEARRAVEQDIKVEFYLTDWGKWINCAVPAGDYNLKITVPAAFGLVTVPEYTQTYRFKVKAQSLNSDSLYEKTEYEFPYNGSIQLPEVNIEVAHNNEIRQGTGWEDEQFNSHYDTGYMIEYSVESGDWLNEAEIAAELPGMLRDVWHDEETGEILSYSVYYRISAENFVTVGGRNEQFMFTVKIVPSDNEMVEPYTCTDIEEGGKPAETAPKMKFQHEGGLQYDIMYFTDEACKEEYTETDFPVGRYYVKVIVPGTANFNDFERVYSFEVYAKSAVPADPLIHRPAGADSPNGFSITTPSRVNTRVLIIVGIVIGVIILLLILVLIAILALRAHRRRKLLFERILNITSKPISAYLPPQYSNPAALGYGGYQPYQQPVNSLPPVDLEDPDEDGFYDEMNPNAGYWQQPYYGQNPYGQPYAQPFEDSADVAPADSSPAAEDVPSGDGAESNAPADTQTPDGDEGGEDDEI